MDTEDRSNEFVRKMTDFKEKFGHNLDVTIEKFQKSTVKDEVRSNRFYWILEAFYDFL